MKKPMSRVEWRRRRRRKAMIVRVAVFTTLLIILGLIIWGVVALVRTLFLHEKIGTLETAAGHPVYNRMLSVSEFSRPGTRLKQRKVSGIVIHSVETQGTTATERRNYYESLSATGANHLSVHFIVGLEGEILQCIPVTEQSYANGAKNSETISIEFCINSEDGSTTDAAYAALTDITAALVKRYKLKADGIYRHSDITQLTGGACPGYFMDEGRWAEFKADVMFKAGTIKK